MQMIQWGDRAEAAFVTENPGDWIFGCHLQEGGMMSIIRTARG